MKYDETEAYRHASHGCTTPEDERCCYCEAEAEVERLESQVAADEANWLRAFALTNPIDAFTKEVV